MIDIFRSHYDSKLNKFYGRVGIRREEVVIRTKTYFDNQPYTWAEPSEKGSWAFGGTLLFTSNGIYPEFNTPIKLHDRDMSKEK